MSAKLRGYFTAIKNGRLTELKKEIAWIYGYGRRHVFAIALYTLLGMSSTLVGLFSSLVSRDLVDIITGHQTGELLKTFATIIGAQLIGVVISQSSLYVSTRINLAVDNSLKADVYDEIMTTDWESLTRFHSGELQARWSGDVSIISQGLLNFIPNLIIYTFKFGSALFMVCKYDPSFAVIAIVSVPIALFTQKTNMRRMRRVNMGSMATSARMSAFTTESFSNTQNLKALNMLPLYSKRLRSLQQENTALRMRYQKVSTINSVMVTLTTLFVTYSTYGWGIYKVWSGQISYGTMTMFLALSTTLSGSSQSLLSLAPNAISLINATHRVMRMLSLPKEDYSLAPEVEDFYEKNRQSGIGVSIRDLSYRYRTGTEVFEHVSFDARPHEVVALIGPSGEGKTTMLRVLLALIRGQGGRGYLCAEGALPGDTTGTLELTAAGRRLFAYVPQGNTMFSGTIKENMLNVKEDATDEEIVEALKCACAWEFVEKLPEGIYTQIQERGGGFSEGQAQRLSIARALLRKSPILLLDEATSALDMDTERRLLQNIGNDKTPRTCIVTTHRPAVMDICDKVYTIKDKKVILQ